MGRETGVVLGAGAVLTAAYGLASLGVAGRPAAAANDAPAGVRQEANAKGESMSHRYSKSGYDLTPYPPQKVAELAAGLDAMAYHVTQRAGTEGAFCGGLVDNKKEGLYTCVVCGLPVFSSEHKFNSGTGWPSFYTEFDPEHVTEHPDDSFGMARTEITCARCGAHLGHVFDDGPHPTGKRHCVNSASLKFIEESESLPPESRPDGPAGDKKAGSESVRTGDPKGTGDEKGAVGDKNSSAKGTEGEEKMKSEKGTQSVKGETGTQIAYFAGGCFWGLEHYFQLGPGVLEAVSGYMQGKVDDPTYDQVCTDSTGHAETVKVVFDPRKITYRRLLEAFFAMHDPTQVNRQGPDVGEQYRSGIWYANQQQKKEAESYIQELQESRAYRGRKIVTQIEAAKTFYPAEEYHQDYIEKTGRACHVTNPW